MTVDEKSLMTVMTMAESVKFGRNLVCAGLLLFSAFLIYLPSELGAALTIPPDSSEYSICLVNLFDHGRFGFTLNGAWYPSRYAPWFSLTCLTPAYLLSGGDPLCFHWAILFFSLALLIMIYQFGKKVGLGRASIVPPVLLMFLPDFVFYSRVVMTEIPYTALLAATTLFFVKFASARSHSRWLCLGAGVLVAWLGMVRVTGLPMLLAFLAVLVIKRKGWRLALGRALLTSAPVAAYIFANLSYNYFAFGSFFRSGYKYWASVPCDFPKLMFNLDNVDTVAYMMTHEAVGLLTISFVLLTLICYLLIISGRFGGVRSNSWFIMMTSYLFLQTIVLIVLYGGSYWADTRFFLPLTICFIPLAFFAVVKMFLVKVGPFIRTLTSVVLVVLCFVAMHNASTRYLYMTVGRPIWLAEAQISGAVLPMGSIVMQQGDPNVLDHFGFKSKGVALLPIRRDFDYVKYMTAPRQITDIVPTPKSVEEMIIPELVASGVCGLPFPHVFEESPDVIQKYVSDGKRVFLLQGHFYNKDYFNGFKSRIESMGFTLKLFGVWNVPEISPNPVRRLYDQFLFPGYSMDSRPEITAAYYEVVVAEGHDTSPLGLSDIKQGEGDKK